MLYLTLLQPLINPIQLMLQMAVHYAVHKVKEVQHYKTSDQIFKRFDVNAYRRAAISLFIASFHSTAYCCFRLVVCVDVDGESRVQSQPTVSCDEGWYQEISVAANFLQAAQIAAAVLMFWRVWRTHRMKTDEDEKIVYFLALRHLMQQVPAKLIVDLEDDNSMSSEDDFEGLDKDLADTDLTVNKTAKADLEMAKVEEDKVQREKIRRARFQQWGSEARPFVPANVPNFIELRKFYDHYGPLIVSLTV